VIALTEKELEMIKEKTKQELLDELRKKRKRRWLIILYVILGILIILSLPLENLLSK